MANMISITFLAQATCVASQGNTATALGLPSHLSLADSFPPSSWVGQACGLTMRTAELSWVPHIEGQWGSWGG